MKIICVYFLSAMCLPTFFCKAQQSKIDSLKSVIASGNHDFETLKSMNLIAIEYVRTDVEKAKFYLWKAKNLGKKLQNDRSLSATYAQLASINQNQGLMDSASIYLNASKELADNAVGTDANTVIANYHSTAGLYNKSG